MNSSIISNLAYVLFEWPLELVIIDEGGQISEKVPFFLQKEKTIFYGHPVTYVSSRWKKQIGVWVRGSFW